MAPKVPMAMTAGAWRDFEYTWMKWAAREWRACR